MNAFDDHWLRQQLRACAEGQPHAREAILADTRERFEAIARRMLHGRFSRLAAAEQTGDILQSLLVRLLSHWQQTVTTAEGEPVLDPAVYLLRVSRLMRETFLDLVRKHHGRDGERPGVVTRGGPADDSTVGVGREPGGDTYNPEMLARHTEFHDAVGALPDRLRQVVDLHWYQGYTQAQVGVMLGLSEHGVRKRWAEARLKLVETLGPVEDWPGSR